MKRGLLIALLLSVTLNSILYGQDPVETKIDTSSFIAFKNSFLKVNISNTDSEDIVIFVSRDPLNNNGPESVIRRAFFTRVGDFSLFDFISEGMNFEGFITDNYTFPYVVKFLKSKESFTIFLNNTKKLSLSDHLVCLRKKTVEDYLKISLDETYTYNKSRLLYYIDTKKKE
ncbi:MAG: hypothetical protein J5604_03110 [Bacteroidales bacterium]|nr:hypothetical protein [Bacteroidales bacterium]